MNHTILLDKLERYGVRGVALNWFTSYLSGRKQYVSVNNANSDFKEIVCGVPQGSILGPLLFLLYVNDIVNVSKVLFPLMFADDTNVFISGKNLQNITTQMNNELSNVCTWLTSKKLSLNVKKTH